MVERPVSKTPSSARTETCMAKTVSKVAVLSIPRRQSPLVSSLRTKISEELAMLKVGLFVRLEAKMGKEAELAAFLEQGLALANDEAFTPVWFALKFGPSSFAIFDAFVGEPGRQSHLAGELAKALMAKAPELLATSPSIEELDVIGANMSVYARACSPRVTVKRRSQSCEFRASGI